MKLATMLGNLRIADTTEIVERVSEHRQSADWRDLVNASIAKFVAGFAGEMCSTMSTLSTCLCAKHPNSENALLLNRFHHVNNRCAFLKFL